MQPPTARQLQSGLEQLPSRLAEPPSRLTQPDSGRPEPPSVMRTPPSVVVKMNDEAPMYEPANITITAGETVEWKNNGIVEHSASDNAKKADTASDAQLPEGAAPFYSGSIMPGRVYRYTFKVPGVYRYFCDSHESDGMVGQITVKRAPESARNAKSPSNSGSSRALATAAQDASSDSN